MKKVPFAVCNEMKKLRDYLDAHKLPWEDATEKGDNWICRTHFDIAGRFYSAINGAYSMGGFDAYNRNNQGLLEIYGDDFSDPIGYLTAKSVIQILEERNPWLKEKENA